MSTEGKRRRRGILSTLEFIAAYAGANLSMAMEYKAAFLTQLVSMMVNDGMWVVFWVLYFHRFPVVRGWERGDVIVLWAIVAAGFGLGHGLFGNALNLSRVIYEGGLDAYLTQPRDPLLHVLVSRTSPSAWGDFLFGVGVFLGFCHPDPARLALFVLGTLVVAAMHISLAVIAHSLAFFIGDAGTLADQVYFAFLHFSTYPSAIFSGLIKVILFSVLPAGFISHMPVGLLREFSWGYTAILVGVSLALSLGAVGLFRLGLRRYASGNLLTIRV
ncbi:MAG: ABC-2 family transporter protein [Bacillota bacterium]